MELQYPTPIWNFGKQKLLADMDKSVLDSLHTVSVVASFSFVPVAT